MGWILLLIFIFIVYQLIKPKVPKPNSFDSYLIQYHKESEKRASLIPNAVIPVTGVEVPAVVINNTILTSEPVIPIKNKKETLNYTLAEELYLGALKEPGRYPIDEIRKEALQAFKCTEQQLNDMLANFKMDKRKKTN